MDQQIAAMTKAFDGKIAALKAEQNQHAKRLEEQKLAADTDEDDDSSDESVMVVDEATEKAEESVEAAKSTKVKVRSRYLKCSHIP
jgi:hypothetical protein